jgi:hypothetical protein
LQACTAVTPRTSLVMCSRAVHAASDHTLSLAPCF